jgi:protein gp37
MNCCKQHTFQILTKRSERLAELAPLLNWSENIWMGVTVENQDSLNRINDLRQVNANVRFLSLEPLLGPLDGLILDCIDWVIVGGESGPGARPIKEDWVLSIKAKCQQQNVPFFFKQWGGTNKKKNGRLLKGRTWEELPEPIIHAAS